MNKRFCSLTSLVFCMVCADAQTLTERLTEHFDSSKDMFETIYRNPAMMADKFSLSLTDIEVGWNGSHASTPVRLEYGDGSTFWGGKAQAFIKKDDNSLWGRAVYSKGSVRNIKFCESSDFDVIAPYVMADTVGGGDSEQENYLFMGGFAHKINDKWVIGAQGQYSATMEYREKDPRPKNLSGDLDINVGTSYDKDGQLLGAAVSFRRYKQTNELKFYNEVSVPTVYHMTGVGTDYYRFRGANTSTYYQGTGWGAVIGTKPVAKTGIYASLGYDYMSLDKIISSLNELPMTTLNSSEQQFEIGFLHGTSFNTWGVKIIEEYQAKKGIENIFGSAEGNIYPQIASEQQYKLSEWDVAIEGMYQRKCDKAIYNVTLHQGYEKIKETHAEPYRLATSSAVVSSLKANAMWFLGRMMISAHAAYTYMWSMNNDMSLGDAVSSLSKPTENYYSYLASDRSVVDCGVKIAYDTKHKYDLYVAYDVDCSYYMKGEKTRNMKISVGIEF